MIFDDNQITAIKAPPGPVLVTAGPGSGKTAVLTQRIRYLKNEYNIPYEKILVITFTKAAALQMKSRFENECGGDFKTTFCTFHSLFYSIIRDFDSNEFSIISLNEKLNIIKTVLLDAGCDISRIDLKIVLDEISKFKNLDVSFDAFLPISLDKDLFLRIFNEYNRELKDRMLMDYDDFVIIVNELFEKDKSFLKKWQNKYGYCLIDEFQDINLKQYETISRIFVNKGVFAVGDEDQSIYGFRGSSSDICIKFKKDFNADVFKLVTNYRSDSRIVEAAMKLITFNSLRFDKRIVPKKNAKEGEYAISGFDSSHDEYEMIAKEVKDSLKKGRRVAILLRTNNIPDSLNYSLLKEKVPVNADNMASKDKNSEFAKDVVTYFKMACGETTYENLLRIANKPNRYISRRFLAECKSCERKKGDVFSYVNLIKCAKDKKYLALNLFKFEKQMKELKKLDSFEGLIYVMNVIGYEKYLFEKGTKNETEYEELKNMAREFIYKEDFIEYFELVNGDNPLGTGNPDISETVEIKEKPNKVDICTIHASKGREWDEVYIPDVNEGNIPHKKSVSKEDIEEERRLFYVAMTRAKEKLFISYVKDSTSNLSPSLFARELKSL